MKESFEVQSEAPRWYSEEVADDVEKRFQALVQAEKDASISALERLSRIRVLDFLKTHPDARDYYLFSIVSGGRVAEERMANMKGFDYPDGDIQRLVAELEEELGVTLKL